MVINSENEIGEQNSNSNWNDSYHFLHIATYSKGMNSTPSVLCALVSHFYFNLVSYLARHNAKKWLSNQTGNIILLGQEFFLIISTMQPNETWSRN